MPKHHFSTPQALVYQGVESDAFAKAVRATRFDYWGFWGCRLVAFSRFLCPGLAVLPSPMF